MLAQAARDLLPPVSHDESIAITKLRSLSSTNLAPASQRPFRNPHHSSTLSNLIGSKLSLLPGEISLAHHGVLFLDEFPEFSSQAIEALRTPLETKQITLCHANTKVTYPADFMLIAAMNPCPCGYHNTGVRSCNCTPHQLYKYQKKLSGPILDRIDMTVQLQAIDASVLLKTTTNSTRQDASAKTAIARAYHAQTQRYHSPAITNAALNSVSVCEQLKLSPSARQLLNEASAKLQLSARAYFQTIKIAQTIADLDAVPIIDAPQIAEALRYRRPF